MIRIILAAFLSFFVFFLSGCDKHAVEKQGYFEGRFTYMASQATGVLQSVAVQRGQSVKTGQLLFQLQGQPTNFDVQSAHASYLSAQANMEDLLKGQRPEVIQKNWFGLEAAKAQYIYAKQTLARQQLLVQTDNAAVSEFNQAQQDYKVAKNTLKQAEQQIVIDNLQARVDQIESAKELMDAAKAKWLQMQWLLSQKTVYAPDNAFVFDTFYYPGEVVPANSPVLSLLTPQNTYALFYVNAKELAMLKLGQSVNLSCDACQPSTAKITYISPKPEYTPPVIYSASTQDRLLYRVEATPASSDKMQFHPGEGVTVTFQMTAGS